MMHRAIFFAILMLAAQPLQAQPAGLETVRASNAYIDCLVRAARRLDDGHSDTAGMGRAIQGACLSEQHRWETAQTAHFPDEKKRAFLEDIKAHTAAVAVSIVLEERRFRRN